MCSWAATKHVNSYFLLVIVLCQNYIQTLSEIALLSLLYYHVISACLRQFLHYTQYYSWPHHISQHQSSLSTITLIHQNIGRQIWITNAFRSQSRLMILSCPFPLPLPLPSLTNTYNTPPQNPTTTTSSTPLTPPSEPSSKPDISALEQLPSAPRLIDLLSCSVLVKMLDVMPCDGVDVFWVSFGFVDFACCGGCQ